MNPIHNSGNSSNVSISVPYQSLSLGKSGPYTWYHPHGMTMMNTSATIGMVNPQGPTQFSTGDSFGNTNFPYAIGNSLMQFQSNSVPSQLPMFPNANSQYVGGPGGNFSGQPMEQYFPSYQYNRNNMATIGPLNTSAMGASNWFPPMPRVNPMCYQGQSLPLEKNFPPSLSDFQNYVNTWEVNTLARFII
ncbi:hypothetical protein SESBI_02985 [Sesbania bispinosa]|nr:hypothetical protein SESBI_02985 [Sesbania bispinosa]